MNQNDLTNNHLNALNQAKISHKNSVKTSFPGVYKKDFFGLMLIKSGINSKTYVEFGGSLFY